MIKILDIIVIIKINFFFVHIQTNQADNFSEVEVQGNFILVLRTVRVHSQTFIFWKNKHTVVDLC